MEDHQRRYIDLVEAMGFTVHMENWDDQVLMGRIVDRIRTFYQRRADQGREEEVDNDVKDESADDDEEMLEAPTSVSSSSGLATAGAFNHHSSSLTPKKRVFPDLGSATVSSNRPLKRMHISEDLTSGEEDEDEDMSAVVPYQCDTTQLADEVWKTIYNCKRSKEMFPIALTLQGMPKWHFMARPVIGLIEKAYRFYRLVSNCNGGKVDKNFISEGTEPGSINLRPEFVHAKSFEDILGYLKGSHDSAVQLTLRANMEQAFVWDIIEMKKSRGESERDLLVAYMRRLLPDQPTSGPKRTYTKHLLQRLSLLRQSNCQAMLICRTDALNHVLRTKSRQSGKSSTLNHLADDELLLWAGFFNGVFVESILARLREETSGDYSGTRECRRHMNNGQHVDPNNWHDWSSSWTKLSEAVRWHHKYVQECPPFPGTGVSMEQLAIWGYRGDQAKNLAWAVTTVWLSNGEATVCVVKDAEIGSFLGVLSGRIRYYDDEVLAPPLDRVQGPMGLTLELLGGRLWLLRRLEARQGNVQLCWEQWRDPDFIGAVSFRVLAFTTRRVSAFEPLCI